MEGPTPVSALIHSATMVCAGVYLIARSSFLFAHAPEVGVAVAIIGTVTAFLAATVALVENDIKRVLAYSTVSQIGFMFVALGAQAYTRRPVSSVHSRVFQIAPVSWLRLSDSCPSRRAESETHGRSAAPHARHLPHHAGCLCRALGGPRLCRFLLERRHHRRNLPSAQWLALRGRGSRDFPAHRLLLLALDVPGVLRQAPRQIPPLPPTNRRAPWSCPCIFSRSPASLPAGSLLSSIGPIGR